MIVYQISKEKYIYDLSGIGSSKYPGRWNSKNTFVVYTAATPSLALLESVVHIKTLGEVDYFMATIILPDIAIKIVGIEDLPINWSVSPPPERLKLIGDQFINEGKYLSMRIPSAIMPEDFTYLLNPAHPAFKNVSVKETKSINIDSRLMRSL